jgi:hypothetical protein
MTFDNVTPMDSRAVRKSSRRRCACSLDVHCAPMENFSGPVGNVVTQ